MGKIVMTEQSDPGTPSSGMGNFWFDTTSSLPCYKDDSGRAYTLAPAFNAATASQGAGFSSDTYVTNSGIIIPGFGLQAKAVITWILTASKTAAGVAAPVYQIRLGSNQSTADTSIVSMTGTNQTAAVDTGELMVKATLRNTGAAGVLQATTTWIGRINFAAGFSDGNDATVQATSSSFDTTSRAGQYFGLSINAGASAAWTVTQVIVDAKW